MSAYAVKAHEFQDPDIIADVLLRQLPTDLPEAALGFLSCDSQVDSAGVLRAIRQRLPLTLVGGTSFTYPLADGTNEVSAELTVLDIQGMTYSIQVSDPLDEAKGKEQMQALYQACTKGLSGAPRLLMPFIPLIPGLTHDLFLSELFSLAGGIPVFGGVTTDDLDVTRAAVYYNDKAFSDRMVLIALGGEIRPVFSVGSQLTVLSEYGPTVTESQENIVKRVDDMTFCDYMKSIGIAPEQRVNGIDALVQYGPLPCRLRHKLQDDDGVPEIRCISYTNIEEGSVAFSSSLPVGTRLNMGTIVKDDVTQSSEKSLNDLLQKMAKQEASGYRYSVLFSIPCVARYFAMLGGENVEAQLLRRLVPPNLAISTYYGFCEIGPTQGKDGEIHNRSHNASIVMCAL